MDDSLVMRRSRRSTAGNRMEAALAEFKAEELGQDIEEDIDFIMGKGMQLLISIVMTLMLSSLTTPLHR